MSSAQWRLDVGEWPGPDRARWNISRDIVTPSPDGRYACVLYSCTEVRLNCEAGLLTILEGPPHAPTVLLQPPDFTCLDFSPGPSAQWLESGRVVVVVSYLYRVRTNRVDLLAFTFLDTATRTFAHHQERAFELGGRQFVETGGDWVIPAAPDGEGGTELRLSVRDLQWRPWAHLRQKGDLFTAIFRGWLRPRNH